MKASNLFIYIVLFFISITCTKDSEGVVAGDGNDQSRNRHQNPEPGIVTAGEWSDLKNWDFWNNLQQNPSLNYVQDLWGFYTKQRIEISVGDGENQIPNAQVELRYNNQVVWSAKTDHRGLANVWGNMFDHYENPTTSEFTLYVDGEPINDSLQFYGNGQNKIVVKPRNGAPDLIDLAFVVDATGSMGDEIEFLKADLSNVIQKVKITNPALAIRSASVFYRDESDEYLTRRSPFSYDNNETIDFIKQQSANGGGDYREAVHSALNVAINQLQWSSNARAKILFILLDAPPHQTPEIAEQIRMLTKSAAQNGITIIPVAGSGIDKEAEFLMRNLAIATNGTYVFITDDSGIGNDHLEATVGDYEVEFLNNLMERLISDYAQ